MSLKSFTKNEPIENGISFKDNALIKARFASKLTSHYYPTVADDSGICIDNLDGAPGIYSARWAYKNNYTFAFDKIKKHLNKELSKCFSIEFSLQFLNRIQLKILSECKAKRGPYSR